MPIITCPDCGQKVSNTAKACPNCGYAVAQQAKFKVRQAGCGVFLVFAAIVIGIAALGTSRDEKDHPEPPAPRTPLIGETWFAKGPSMGCYDEKDFRRLVDLARQDDHEAFARLALIMTAAGKCKSLQDNTQVVIEDTAVFGFPCVRPKGEPYCVYVGHNALKSQQN